MKQEELIREGECSHGISLYTFCWGCECQDADFDVMEDELAELEDNKKGDNK